jgi:DNA-binding CsgD family transcriptional regulator
VRIQQRVSACQNLHVSVVGTEERIIGRADEIERGLGALGASVNLLVTSRSGQGRSSFARHVAASSNRTVRLVRADAASRLIPFGALASLVSLPGEPLGDGADAVSLAVQRLVHTGSASGPVIVVDEASDLDAQSALALALATDHGALLVLGSERAEGLPPALAALGRSGRMVEVQLGPICGAVVELLAADVLGGPVEPVMVRTLAQLVGGAPGSIVETLEAARRLGAVRRIGRIWRQIGPLLPPPSVVDRVAVVTGGLHQQELDALDVVLIGASVPLEPLECLASPACVEALEVHGLVEAFDVEGHPYVKVSDPLVRWVRLDQMPQSRRRRLAGLFRDELRAMPAAQTSADAAARSLLDASLALRSGEAIDEGEALAAARQARQTGEVELAEGLCRSAVARSTDPDTLIFLAELLTSLGRNREAEELLCDLDPQQPSDVAIVAMARAVNLAFHLDDVDAATTILTETIECLDDEPWLAEMIGVRGVIELLRGHPHRALDLVQQYLATPRGRCFVEAATAAGPALVVIGRHLDAAALAQQAFEERVRLGDQPWLSSAGLHALVRSMGLGEAGCFREADELSRFVMAVASEQGERDGEMWAGVIGGRSLLDQGRFGEALTSFEIAAAAATDLNLTPQLRWARGGALLAIAQTGDPDGARQALLALDACPPTPLEMMASEVERARAWAAIACADIRSGVERLVAAADIARCGAQPGLEILALHDLVRIGRVESAGRLVEVAAAVQGELAVARSAHAAALAADDATALVDVAVHFEALGAVVLAAEAANQASWSHRRRGARGNAERERARTLRLWATRPEAATPALDHAPDMAWLTTREREVATMAASGDSSKDIAARLGVSARTVDNLLQRVYRKLGVSGREALRAARMGETAARGSAR